MELFLLFLREGCFLLLSNTMCTSSAISERLPFPTSVLPAGAKPRVSGRLHLGLGTEGRITHSEEEEAEEAAPAPAAESSW